MADRVTRTATTGELLPKAKPAPAPAAPAASSSGAPKAEPARVVRQGGRPKAQ